jgi:Tfp pilus assembly protein PilN
MRAIQLDYQRNVSTTSLLDLALLALGLVALIWLGYAYSQVKNDGAYWSDKLATQNKPQRSRPAMAADTPETQGEAKLANEITAQLNLPWNELFSAIERAPTVDVALLAIEPDAVKHTVQISAEARNFAAMLAYLKALDTGGKLSNIYLQNHQVQAQDPNHPVRFGLVASWIEYE